MKIIRPILGPFILTKHISLLGLLEMHESSLEVSFPNQLLTNMKTGKSSAQNTETLGDSFPLVHLGVTSNNELKLCIVPILADSSTPDPTSRNGFLKKLQVSDPLKKFAAKNNLKLKLGKNSTAVSSQKDWWKSTLEESHFENQSGIKLSRPLGEESLISTNVLVIECKKGSSKTFINIAQLLKEANFRFSSPLEDFLAICHDLDKEIVAAEESETHFYFSEVELINLNRALTCYHDEYQEGLKKLGWRSTFKLFSELGEKSQDLLFFDRSKRRPGSLKDLDRRTAANQREEVRSDFNKFVDIAQNIFENDSKRPSIEGEITLKVPDISYEKFQSLFIRLIGPLIECRVFNIEDRELEHKLNSKSVDYCYQPGEMSPYFKAKSLLWKLLIGRSQAYSAKAISEYERALSFKMGLEDRSAYIQYLELFPTKALFDPGYLITAPSSNGISKVDFGAPDPEFSSLTPVQKEKLKTRGKNPPLLRLKDFLQSSKNQASPSVISDKYFWPKGRLYQLIHYTQSMVTLPEIGTSAEFLFGDDVGISADIKSILGEKDSISLQPELSFLRAYNQLEGLYPTNIVPDQLLTHPQFPYSASPHTIEHIEDLGFKDKISINVRYSNADGLAIEQCLEALKKDFTNGRLSNTGGEKIGEKTTGVTSSSSQVGLGAKEPHLEKEGFASHYDAILDKLKDLLQFEAIPYFVVDGTEVSEADWFKAKETPTGAYEIAPGQFIPENTYKSHTENYYLKKKTLAKMGRIPLQRVWSSHLNFISGNDETVNPEAYLQSLKLSISKEFDKLDEILKNTSAKDWIGRHLPQLESALREYQAQGIMWIKSRLAMNYGVCLADEMGLGKTLQAIGLLMLLKNPKLPSLVIVPKSLLVNWKNELERFAPGLKVKVIEDASSFDDSEIYLMSYGAMRHKAQLITERDWNLAILDEAQSIKNSQSLTSQIAQELKSKYRLALTGTPVENHASELWSIINWLNPQYLGTVSSFEKFTRHARVAEKRPFYLAPLRECLKPIILRRLKNDPQVALGLPEKVTQDLRMELSETQCLLYKSVIDVVMNGSPNMPHFARMAQYLRSILFLKQICIHPSLFLDDVTTDEALETSELTKRVKKNALKVLKKYEKPKTSVDLFKDSTKLAQLYEILEAERYSSNGILIFTQYLKSADLLLILLKDLGYDSVPFINGSLTSNRRQELVDQFNNRAAERKPGELCPILICSLKAGGTGLNLTGADRVIHLDRWWNPAVENQATDRAHRFGQTKTVFVNTLTNDGTLEDSMNRIFEEKRRLSQDLLSDEDVAIAECLKDESGYLNLVDPKQLFFKN